MQGGAAQAKRRRCMKAKTSLLCTPLCVVWGFVEGSVIIIPLNEQRWCVVPIEH